DRLEVLAGDELLLRELRTAHTVAPQGALAVARAIPCVDVPPRQRALELVRLDEACRRLHVRFLLGLDLDETVLPHSARKRRDEILLARSDVRLRRLLELELPERLLQLLAHAFERRVCVDSDHRSDVLEREADCARLERRQARREPERVAPQLLVHVDGAVAQLGVDRVAAAAEVDEVEEREVLLELVGRDGGEALEELVDRNGCLLALAAGGEEGREQRLEDGEALRSDRAGGALRDAVHAAQRRVAGRLGSTALVPVAHAAQGGGHLTAELLRLERDGAAVLPQHPARELLQRRVLGDPDAVLEAARGAVRALHPPAGLARHLDARLADDVSDLPRRPAAELLDVELGRDAEVALAPGGETDLAADARDAERADVVPVEVVADDVPDAVVGQERVRIERALGLDVARDRPVVELDRALLRDRAFELREASGHLRRVIRVEHLDAIRGRGGRLGEPRAAEGEVLQREPQRFGVGELSFEQVQRGVERGELLVLEL